MRCILPFLFLIPLSVGAADVTVKLEGVNFSRGDVFCSIFSNPEDFDSGEPLQATRSSDLEEGDCIFSDLPNGVYAVKAFQDQNGNMTPDKNFLGLPKEPWGLSNGSRPRFTPVFEDAAFAVNGDTTIYVGLDY